MKTKKELKEEYKQKKFSMGVFRIVNTANGKMYVDSSVNLDAIWNRHRTQLRFGTHDNKQLQEDWNRLGEEHFKFEIVEELILKEDSTANPNREIKALEAACLEELQPFGEKGYMTRK